MIEKLTHDADLTLVASLVFGLLFAAGCELALRKGKAAKSFGFFSAIMLIPVIYTAAKLAVIHVALMQLRYGH